MDMDARRSVILVVIIGVLLVVVWALVSFVPPIGMKFGPPTVKEVPYHSSEPIVVRHSVADGTHVFEGNVPISSCEVLSTSIVPSGRDPIRVTLVLRVLGDDDSPCTETSTVLHPFSVSLSPTDPTEVMFDGLMINGQKVESIYLKT